MRAMSTEPKHPDLIAAIEAYRAKHNVARSTFGDLVMGDPRFVGDLDRGRELRRDTERRVWEALEKTPDELKAEKAGAAA